MKFLNLEFNEIQNIFFNYNNPSNYTEVYILNFKKQHYL